MSEKQLNKDEIQQIFQFLEKNGVKYYDVQLEMVDHFASEIEQNWEHYPEHFTLEHKISDVYSRIGDIGFGKIIQAKSIAANKWFWKHSINFIKSFFSWPKIIITATLMILFYTLIMQFDDPIKFGFGILFFGILTPLTFFMIGLGLKIHFKYKRKILGLNTIGTFWVCLGYNGVYGFMALCDATSLSQNANMPYILTLFFALSTYFAFASVFAFYHCYKDLKLYFPNLT